MATHQVSIKVGLVGPARVVRGVTTEEAKITPELSITVHDSSLLGGLEKAIRLLTCEYDAMLEAMPVTKGINRLSQEELEDQDEEDEDA